MLEFLRLNLQLFGEGGEGGDGGSSSATGETAVDTSGENIPAHIPERAKKYYQKALAKNKPQTSVPTQTTSEPKTTEAKMSYADLIKSDEYKDEHKAYMDKTIGDRLKKYKGLEETHGKAKALLDVVANKYGVDTESEDFFEVLGQKIEADDSYYENYAMEHNISAEEARRVVTMERKVAQIEAEQEQKAKQEHAMQQIMLLRQNAEKTKAQFPQFDLETEMKDEKFRRLCAVNNGDTTSAYMACHWKDLTTNMVQMATRQVQAQTAQAVAANKARPIENGLSSASPSVATTDFSKMSLQELRAFADSERRKKIGR